MRGHDIIVIGGSAGAFEPLRSLLAELPAELRAIVCVVLHRAPSERDLLPGLLSRHCALFVKSAVDGERPLAGTVYLAPADRHLLLDEHSLALTRGPRENQFRPAIDVLFRSAAVTFGSRVIGVLLSGALDDGASGIAAIKRCGGIAIVQDPADAQMPDMPEAALRHTKVDAIVPAREIASLLQEMVGRPPGPPVAIPQELFLEAQLAASTRISLEKQNELGELTPLNCPDCSGPLWKVHGEPLRFRCLTGHTLSAKSLGYAQTQQLEAAVWSAIRQFEQRVNLMHSMADNAERLGRSRMSSSYRDRANEAHSHSEVLRALLLGFHDSPRPGLAEREAERLS
jgi:two-component system chemotaxis response regulator CheB